MPVVHATFIANVPDAGTSRAYLDQLTVALLSTKQRELPFAGQLELLEPLIVDRAQLVGTDPATDVAAILAEQLTHEAGAPGSSADAPAQLGAAAGSITIGHEAFHAATLCAGFRRVAARRHTPSAALAA